MTKGLKLGSCSFHSNVALCLTSLMTKFEGVTLNQGLKLEWGGFGLRNGCYISEMVQDRA